MARKHHRQREYIEFNDLTVDYNDGDIVIFDNVKNFQEIFPLNSTTNMIGLCTKGHLTMSVYGIDTRIKEDDILFCPPNIKIDNCKFSKDFECRVLCLSNRVVQGLLRDKMTIWNNAVFLNQTNIIPMSKGCKEVFALYHALICNKISSKHGSSREIVQAIIRALLIELCDILEASDGKGEEPRMLQSRQIFNQFLKILSNVEVKHQPATFYAAQLNISPKYLTMLCRQYSNKSASDWIIQYTLDDIRYYLTDLNYSVKEIAFKLGFSNISHFGAYVRKHLGLSPMKYRAQLYKKDKQR
jgi:AraC-like DNA-binding protein